MKKNLLRIVSFCLCITLSFMILNTTTYAKNIESSNKLCSYVSTEEINIYAQRILVPHLHALQVDNLCNYQLGQAFTATDVKTNNITYFYPVIRDNSIVYILQVNQDENTGELSSSLSDAFADEIQNLLSKKSGITYNLLTDGNSLQAFDGNKVIELYKISNDGKIVDLSKSLKKDNEMIIESITKDNTTTKSLEEIIQVTSNLNDNFAIQSVPQPSSYKTVDIEGVPQGSHPWCWAATCAALIKFYEGYDISAGTVAYYVNPNNAEQGGDWTEIKKAYNNWGLYPYQTDRISFSTIKSKINSNQPMHIRLAKGEDKHSIALIGYEDWNCSDSTAKILIFLEPNGGIHTSVTLKSNGNFNYGLDDITYSWVNTIIF